jgi:hypothetical protein
LRLIHEVADCTSPQLMKIEKCILAGATLILLASCSPQLTPFTQKLYDQYAWSEEELRKIQFYLSDDIVLRRKFAEGSSTIQKGKIKTIDGQKIEEIVFRRGTPGVFLFSPKDKRFAVSFESAEPPKYLMFGPNPKISNRYALLGKTWETHEGTITYDGETWYTTTESAFASLLVDLDRAQYLEQQKKVVRGQRVEE